MEAAFYVKNKTGEIEDFEFKLNTAIHFKSPVVTEEVCFFVCILNFSQMKSNKIKFVELKQFVFYLEGYYLNTCGFWKKELGRTYYQ